MTFLFVLLIFYFCVGRDSPLPPLSLSQCLSLQFVLCITTFYMILPLLLTTDYSVFTSIQTQLLQSYLDVIFVQISVLQTNPIPVYGSQAYNFFLSFT